MKMRKVLIAVAILTCFALAGTAQANTVKVSGDIQKEGKLLVDVDWSVDSSRYPGMSRDAVRQKIHDEIWDQMLPKIIDAAKGASVSFDKSNFVLIKEYTDLVQRRPDGSKLYTLKVQVEFNVPVAQTAAQPVVAKATAKPATVQPATVQPAAVQPAATQPVVAQAAPETPKKDIDRDSLKQRWDNEL